MPRHAPAPPPQAPMRRVVIVEDNALVAKYFRYLLEQHGFTVVVTESGDEVVALARDPATVAVILDVSLRSTQLDGEYVDGIRLGRALKDDGRAARVAVIVATAHVMVGDRERFLEESGADAFVTKPLVDPGELPRVIETLTAARATKSPD